MEHNEVVVSCQIRPSLARMHAAVGLFAVLLLTALVGESAVDAASLNEFENMALGKPPPKPWLCRNPKEYDSVKITDEMAASGTRCLAVSYDIPREDRHKHIPASATRPLKDTGTTGTAVFEGNVAFNGDTRIGICLRGGPELVRSVALLNCMGKLHFGGRLVWRPVVPDRWYHFRFVIHKADGTADLTIGEKDGAWGNVFRNVPVGRPQDVFPLRYLTIYFGGRPRKGARAHFDDLEFRGR